MPLSPADSAAVREKIARRAGRTVAELKPETHLIRDLNIGGGSLGLLIGLIESGMDVKLLPTLRKLQTQFRTGSDGHLSSESRQKLGQTLPEFDWEGVQFKTFDDVWTVSFVEYLVNQALGGKPFQPAESIWDWQQQDWLRQISEVLGNRKIRLLLAACCRYSFQPRQNLEGEVIQALETLERYADTEKTKTGMRSAQKALEQWRLDRVPELKALHQSLDLAAPEQALSIACSVMHHAHGTTETEALARFRAYVHDLIEPETPTEFADSWSTPEVKELARAMYVKRDFQLMPELAEALAKAGCTEPAILDHCRKCDSVHIRGCWVVDRILAGAAPLPEATPKPRTRSPKKS